MSSDHAESITRLVLTPYSKRYDRGLIARHKTLTDENKKQVSVMFFEHMPQIRFVHPSERNLKYQCSIIWSLFTTLTSLLRDFNKCAHART